MILIAVKGHHEEEDGVRGARYLRNPTVMSASGHHHPYEQVYDPMENTDFERYQQRPVDLGNYNRQSYSPNSAHTAAAVVAAEAGWTHHLQAAVASPDWVDARAGHQAAAAGIPWPPHSHDNRYSTAPMKVVPVLEF